MAKENRKVTDKRLKNLKTDAGPGRPKGLRNFATLYREAIVKIAKSTNQDPESFELEIVEQALRKARNGDIRFYQDMMDRLHGKAQQKTDVTSGGEKLQPVLVRFLGDDATT